MSDGGAAENRYDFLISYDRDAESWARWVAWQIEDSLVVDEHRARVFFDVWDVVPGESTTDAMHRALQESTQVVLVLSPRSLSAAQAGTEQESRDDHVAGAWQAVFSIMGGSRPQVVPVRVASVAPAGLLAGRRYVDLAGLNESAAIEALLTGLGHAARGGRGKSPNQPPFPGEAAPTFPVDVQPPPDTTREPTVREPVVTTSGAEPMAPGAPPGGAGTGRRPRRWVAALLATAVIIAAVTTAVVFRRGDDPAAAAVPNVAREPVDHAGPNPFMPPVGDDAAGIAPPSGARGERSADTHGLFGGTRDDAQCDRAKMVAYLKSRPALLTAWAGALGIQPAGIDAYVAGLTPVLLRADTTVTNHGYRDGRITSFPAVLQAGTAVLVDRNGVPVVKCYCGNPLTRPPQHRTVRYTGPRWPTFSERTVTSVRASTQVISVFILIDIETGRPFRRPAGTDGALDRPLEKTPDVDWENTTYSTQCDGSAGRMTVHVRDGIGSAGTPARTYNLTVVRVTTGNLAGNQDPETAVLLECHPSPSNFSVTEVQVFTTGPDRLGTLVPPEADQPLRTGNFDDTLTIADSRLLTQTRDYDPRHGDSHATGPSASRNITWRWNGTRFIPDIGPAHTSPPQAPEPAQPAPTEQADPEPPRSTTTTVTVTATTPWVDTGVDVTAGQPLEISAAGSWRDGDTNPSVTPDGNTSLRSPDNFLNLVDIGVCSTCATTPTDGWGALIGYIGESPPERGTYSSADVESEARKIFLIGDSYTTTGPPRSGRLWLIMNGDAYSAYTQDNSGAVTATITH